MTSDTGRERAPGQRLGAGSEPGTGRGGRGGAARPPAAGCHRGGWVSCSRPRAPRAVIRLLGDDLALVDTGSGEEEVSVAFVPARAGDTILVHAGEAIAVVSS